MQQFLKSCRAVSGPATPNFVDDKGYWFFRRRPAPALECASLCCRKFSTGACPSWRLTHYAFGTWIEKKIFKYQSKVVRITTGYYKQSLLARAIYIPRSFWQKDHRLSIHTCYNVAWNMRKMVLCMYICIYRTVSLHKNSLYADLSF